MSHKALLLIIFSFFIHSTSGLAAIPIQAPQAGEQLTVHHSLIKKKSILNKKKLDGEAKPKKRHESINGLLSIIFGGASLIFFPPLAIPAVILGIISLTKKEPNSWMAITGVTIGSLWILFAIFLLVLFLIVLV